MRIRHVFVFLFLILAFVNCSAEYKLNVAYSFEPLKAEEKLDYVLFCEENLPGYTVIIFRYKERYCNIKLKEIKGIDNPPKLLNNSSKIIYNLVSVGEERDGTESTYLLDGKAGKTYIVGKIYPDYDISEDGRYLCYDKDMYIEKLSPEKIKQGYYPSVIPGIVWKDLETGKTREYDFSDTFLKDEWDSGVIIRYISERDIFSFNFFIEYESFSKGFIKASGGGYQEYKDVIGIGYINSKDVYLRKNPDIKSVFVTAGYHEPVMPTYKVDIIDKIKERVSINGRTDYWYKVRTFTMFEGWIYGAYITIKK